jgi:hypothetical protein
MYGGHEYNYDIMEGRQQQNYWTNNKVWDHQLRLSSVNTRSWNVFGDYRPNLLSPHDLAAAPKQEEERSEHLLLRDLLRLRKSPNKLSRVNDDSQHDAKFQSLRSLFGKRLRRALQK